MADSPASSQSQLDCEKRLSISQFSGSDIDSRRNILPPDVISWDHEQDPHNPQNWSRTRKWVVTLIVSGFAFMAPLSSSTVAPALPQIGQEFKISNDLVRQMTLSIFLLGFTFGPFILAPLSETYGRVLVIETVNCIYVIFNLACGFATSEGQLLTFRLLAGIGGSCTLGIGSGVIRDVWRTEERGLGLSIYTLVPLLGPSIGPIAGGFIAEYSTWRWGFWSITMVNVCIQVAGFCFLKETYAPTILGRKARRLRRETGKKNICSPWDVKKESSGSHMFDALTRPWRLLGTQAIVQVFALYQAYNYGLLYLFIASLPILWTEHYGHSVGIAGLHYIALVLGLVLAALVFGPLNDKIYEHLRRRNGRTDGVPEYRIPLMILGSITTPIGLFWIGVVVYAFGSLICYQCAQVYIVDSYATFAASAAAAAALLRSVAAFAFSLCAPYLFRGLGYGWGGSLLGLISVLFGIPAPFIFWFFGAHIRQRSKFARD